MAGYKRIELSNGEIAEFPDSMSDDDIAAVLRQQFPVAGSTQAAPTHPMPTGQRDLSLSEVPAAMLRNAPSSAANFASDVWNAVSSPVQTAKGLRDVAGGGYAIWSSRPRPACSNSLTGHRRRPPRNLPVAKTLPVLLGSS